MWWPLRLSPLPSGEMFAFLAGRCVGGTTTINTKVALRAHERDVAKWHPASGLTTESGEPFTPADLAPWYDRVEQVHRVRERTDWAESVHTSGASACSAPTSEPVTSYTDANCMRCGSCLRAARPTWQVDDEHVHHDAWALACRAARERRGRAGADRGQRRDWSQYVDETASGTPFAAARSWSPLGTLNRRSS
jgi:choline dehydrogenase-like flavoprotein